MPARRLVECVLLFVAAPLLLARGMQGYLVFPAIWTLATLCLLLLLNDKSFERRELWNAAGVRSGVRAILVRFAIAAPLLIAVLLLYDADQFLSLPRHRPALWAIIMIAYPVLSVYPQEVAFRAFFCHRYRTLFKHPGVLVGANAVLFGFAHIILRNWIAVGLCVIGGVFFTLTYLRTKSLLACCLEHALYGWFLFTIGWGRYLYGGSMNR